MPVSSVLLLPSSPVLYLRPLLSVVPSFEFIAYQLGGNAGSVSIPIGLGANFTGTTNYAVFPSFYYGFSGSTGTYNLNDTLNALTTNIIISAISSSSFVFNLNKTTGNNVNIFITFLVVYNAVGTDYANHILKLLKVNINFNHF